MVQPLWKIVWQSLKRLKIQLSYDPRYIQNVHAKTQKLVGEYSEQDHS